MHKSATIQVTTSTPGPANRIRRSFMCREHALPLALIAGLSLAMVQLFRPVPPDACPSFEGAPIEATCD